jgi:hypothetical protein
MTRNQGHDLFYLSRNLHITLKYRKPPTISPGLILFRKRFLTGLYLYKGGLYTGGLYTWTIFCVSNKQVSHKQQNKHGKL